MSRDGTPAGDSGELELTLQFGDEDGPHRPVDDQRAVMASYLDGTGRVVVDASAGTGKTTTLVVTLAETIVRRAGQADNPLSNILVTTFGREATAELKTRLKELLRYHNANGGDLSSDVFRWIETEKAIRTLDAVFADLLREIAIEIAVPPAFDVDDRLELQEIREDVFAELRGAYRSEFRTLTAAYPAEEWREYPPESVEKLLSTAHQKCREFGISPTDAAESLRESLDVGHGGAGGRWLDGKAGRDGGPESIPPETVEDVRAILEAVVDRDADLTFDDAADAQQLLDHVRETYFDTAEAIDAFGTLLEAFDREYDRRTRRAGQFTFTDVAHLLSSYLNDCEPTDPFRQTLGERFDHVFVDEFQDTSVVQCSVLQRLVDPEITADSGASSRSAVDDAASERSNLFMIGDSKQAIYEWRSADPALFAAIIESAKAAAPEPAAVVPHLGVRDVRYHALTTVFRHHPDIAAAANHVFQRLLEDEGRGAIGDHAPSYVPVEPYRSTWQVDDGDGTVDTDGRADGDGNEKGDGETSDESHIHVLNVEAASDDELTSYIKADEWAAAEADRIGETIAAITNPAVDEPPITVRTNDGERRQPTPGDITLLFRSGRSMDHYANVLREEYGIAADATATGDLFDQPEIRLLVDILSWIATPHSNDDLARLLRSPLVALSDETIRAVLAVETDPETLVESWPASLPADDRTRLRELLSLRADLRWDREGSKTALIHRLLQHSGLDAVMLTGSDPLRQYANVWLFVELVDDWEVDELLGYREFKSRLQQLRAAADSSDPQFPVADVTDTERGDAVTLTTVHQAKGQEYPIVFLCDLPKQSTFPRLQHDRLLTNRRHGFALRPRPGEPPSPDSVRFPTPDRDLDRPVWFNDAFDTTNYPDATGPIWLSDIRTEAGGFWYPNPLNAHLRVRQAEFWRLAYVAFTRAEDHVVVGLGSLDETETEYYNDTRWTTWLAAFNETLEPDAGWNTITARNRDDRTISKELSWQVDSEKRISETVSIGVDEIAPHTPEPTDGPDLTAELDRLGGSGDGVDKPPYWPRTVSASSIADLTACPRAFQYRHIQEIKANGKTTQPARSEMSTRPTRSETVAQPERSETVTRPTRPPGGLAANEWGDIVHRALELRLTDEPRATQYVQKQSTAVRDALQTVIEAVESTTICKQSQSGGELVTEYDLSHHVSTDGRSLRVTGIVDLLYRIDGEWHIVDWKTGTQPADGATTAHRRQLAVYAWLLAEQFDISVETATVAYINPDGSPVVSPVELEAVDTEWVDQVVKQASEAVPFDVDGLEPRPAPEVCGSCPYAEHNAGPCVDDYHADDSSRQ